jgi:hypothetical protein
MLQIYCFGVTYVFLKCWKESRKIVGCLYFFVGRWDMILTFYCKQFGIFYIWYFLVLHGHARRVTKVFLLHVSSFYGSQQKFAKQCRNFENSTYKKCYIRDFFFQHCQDFSRLLHTIEEMLQTDATYSEKIATRETLLLHRSNALD